MRRKRLYLNASEYAQERLKNPSLIKNDGIHCIMCGRNLTDKQRKFCSVYCTRLYNNIKRSRHHRYELTTQNHKEFILTLTEINYSGELWTI